MTAPLHVCQYVNAERLGMRALAVFVQNYIIS
jgi:hypothetical protein